MMPKIIDFVVVTAALLLIARLLHAGLHRRYRAFFLFLILFAMQLLTFGFLDPSGKAYQQVWVITEPIQWLFYAWVVLELYSLVLQDYQGLNTVGRWSLIAAVSVALLASGFSLLVPAHATRQSHLMAYYYMAERAVYFSLSVFLMTILTLLMWFPIRLNRNTMVHSVVFSVYFISNTAIFLLLSTRGFGMIQIAGYAIQAVNLGALVTWLVLLNTAGEQRQQRLRPVWMPGQAEGLANQLNSLNMALLRATRG